MPLSEKDKFYLKRCKELAIKAVGYTYPNPLVGAVLVCENQIIGEGFHQKAGQPHAEILAFNQVKNPYLLPNSTLYVNLEPCHHFGKTPPCTQRIIQEKVKRVVVGSIDPNPKVNQSGIDYLRSQGVDVVLQDNPCLYPQEELNKRFFCYHQKHRPYIILKWAQTADGFIDGNSAQPHTISGPLAHQISHRWRTEEQAILIGKNTALKDNPQLNARLWHGAENTKCIIDRHLNIPSDYRIFNQANVYIFNQHKELIDNGVHYIQVDFSKNIIPQILQRLHELQIQSLMVEGGQNTLQNFIDQDLWDEARVFTQTQKVLKNGIESPKLKNAVEYKSQKIDTDRLQTYFNV